MISPIEIFLLDDDHVFLKTFSDELQQYLNTRKERFRLHSCMDSSDLITKLKGVKQVDLLIADICLGTNADSGIRVAKQVRQKFPSCSIIFLTAFLEFATDIYDTRPLYFILKEEYRQRIPIALDLFFSDRRDNSDSIFLSSGASGSIIRLQDLIYCEHIGRKTKLICTGQEHVVPDKIIELAARLPQKQFIVSHKGYIVNLNYVREFHRYVMTLSTGQELPISRSRYDIFRESFSNFLAQ